MKNVLALIVLVLPFPSFAITITEAYDLAFATLPGCESQFQASDTGCHMVHNLSVPRMETRSNETNNLWGAYGYDTGCPVNTVFDLNTGICDAPPPVCNQGELATFAVLTSSDTQPVTLNTGNIFSVNFNGCKYDFGLSDSQGCYYEPSNSNNLFCTYTGSVTTEGTANIEAVIALQTTQAPPNDSCIYNGVKLICEGSPTDSGCGSIGFSEDIGSFADVCFNDSVAGCVTFMENGIEKELCAGGEKNCGWINGKYVCATESDGLGVNSFLDVGCFTDSFGGVHCLTNDEGINTSANTTTVDNGDGTSTQTTTTTNNIIDSPDYSTSITTDNATSNVTNTTTTGVDPSQESIDLSTLEKNTSDINQNIENAFGISGVNTDIDSSAALLGIDNTAQSVIDGFGLDQVGDGDFLSTVFTWPSGSCVSVPMVFNDPKFGVNLNYDFDPCEKLELFRSMFGWVLYIFTAFFIFSIATKRTS